MGIGTSSGAYYDDEHHQSAAKWDPKYDENILDPEVNDLHTEDKNEIPPDSVGGKIYNNNEPSPLDNQTISDGGTDPNDMTGLFNTPLSDKQQEDYKTKFKPGDSYDYDMQGWYKANPGADPNGEGVHYPDTFKKPNHPTFSDQSQYHSEDTPGGHWTKKDDGSYSFTPGDTNLKYHGKEELQDYFNKVEPKNELKINPGVDDRRNESLYDMLKGYVGSNLTQEKMAAILKHPMMAPSQTMTADQKTSPDDLTNPIGQGLGINNIKDNPLDIHPIADRSVEPIGISPMFEHGKDTLAMAGGAERIKSAALKIGDDLVEGENHGIAFGKWMDKNPDKMPSNWKDGFTTTKGRFVSREEAYGIAEKNKQIDQKTLESYKKNPIPPEDGSPWLISEDLKKPLASEDISGVPWTSLQERMTNGTETKSDVNRWLNDK